MSHIFLPSSHFHLEAQDRPTALNEYLPRLASPYFLWSSRCPGQGHIRQAWATGSGPELSKGQLHPGTPRSQADGPRAHWFSRGRSLDDSKKRGFGSYHHNYHILSASLFLYPPSPTPPFLAQLTSVEQSEVIEEEVSAKEEFPEQQLPELENVTKLEEPVGQKETTEEEGPSPIFS